MNAISGEYTTEWKGDLSKHKQLKHENLFFWFALYILLLYCGVVDNKECIFTDCLVIIFFVNWCPEL